MEDEVKMVQKIQIVTVESPVVHETGLLIDRDVLARFPFKLYQKDALAFAAKRHPLNVYGG